MKCAEHPEVETNLSCGKCGKPICPKCLVQTPVGARCRECANLRRLPTYGITVPQYFRAVGVGLVLAIVLGIVWGILWRILPSVYLNLLIAAGAGYALGEVVSLSVNRKRGLGLQVIAGICFFLSYVIGYIFCERGFTFAYIIYPSIFYTLLLLALGIFIAVIRLR